MKKILLQDVVSIINGFPCKKEYYTLDDTKTPIIRIQNMNDFAFEKVFYDHEYDKNCIVKNGDILFSLSGTIKVYIWKRGSALLNQRIVKIIPNEKKVNKKYIYYLLKSKAEYVKSKGKSSIINNVSATLLKNIEVKETDFNKQQKIADYLDIINEAIENRKTMIANLEQLVKSKFVELFGSIEDNNKNFERKTFDEIAIIDTKMVKDFEKYAEYPHIGIENIEKQTGELVDYKLVKDSNLISGKYIFDERSIIYSKIRPNLNKVATPNFKGLCSADAYPIKTKENVNRIYLAFVLRSQFFLDYILKQSGRASIPKVNKEQLKKFIIPVPPIKLQNIFEVFVQDINKLKCSTQNDILELELLQKIKMHKYFD